jgi:hypothetical protein
MHKLKPKDIILFLRILNDSKERIDLDFIQKLMTIMPIHVEKLKDKELLTLLQVIIDQNIKNERLLNYFVMPRIENRVGRFSFDNYVSCLNLLSSLQYEEDLVFWNEHVLPKIFNLEFTENQIKIIWESLLKVKVNCSLVNISRYIVLVENIMKQFENLRNSGKDLTGILLKLEKDLSLIPSAKKEKMTTSELKEAEKRLKDQNLLKQFMENVDAQTDADSRSKAAMESFTKIIEIKDWKKAKYEMNLAEVEKLREAKEQRKEARKKKISPVEEKTEGEEKTEAASEKKREKVIDITETNQKEENEKAESQGDSQKGKKVKPKKGTS